MGRRQLFVKSFMMKEIESIVDRLLNAIEKQDKEIDNLERELKIASKNRKELGIAYAKKMGIIMTEKQFDKYMKEKNKDPLDEIFVKSFKKKITYSKEARDKELDEILIDIEFCRDWLDVGKEEQDQENQLKVLSKLIEICDKIEEIKHGDEK